MSGLLRTEVVRQFLLASAKPELGMLYHHDMELQVNVGADGGERVEGEWKGKHWNGYRDASETWKAFRIPWKAWSEPEYHDRPLKFSTKHFEGVGLTGWNWKRRRSHWVGFDFDSLVGHQQGLSAKELDEIRTRVTAIPWVTVRRSKGAIGYHLYIFLDPQPETKTHTEHAALARAILSELSGLVGMDLKASVDGCGGVLFIWHRDTRPGGFELLKAGEPLKSIPPFWKQQIEVIEGKGHRVKQPPEVAGEQEPFEQLISRTRHVTLDKDHLRMTDWLKTQSAFSSWDSDRHMLTTHTTLLKKAHGALALRGIFYTDATGKSGPNDKNCFAFPIRGGAWVVRRFGLNTREHAAWQKDANGWTRCLLNHPAELMAASAASGGLEDTKGSFVFKSALKAVNALKDLGAPVVVLPEEVRHRQAKISRMRDQPGRVVLRVKRDPGDDTPEGWLQSSRPKGEYWERIVDVESQSEEPEPPDESVRHVVTQHEDAGWFVATREGWNWEPKQNVVSVLKSVGHPGKEVDRLLGLGVLHPWNLVSIPFEDEYPGARQWNRSSAQLAFSPKPGPHPTWDALINHVFNSLTAAVQEDPWCREHGLLTGGDYGRAWAASLFQFPSKPLPYLFFVGPQGSGKSSFWEALHKLFANPRVGCVRADNSLRSRDGFNGELVGAILCAVEEISLRKNEGAYDRIKDWVLGQTIAIHTKHKTPFDVPNTTHWVQCANNADACPVQVGDTRIVMCYVDPPKPEADGKPMAKDKFFGKLLEEASHFLHTILTLDLPTAVGRTRIPVLETGLKQDQAAANRSDLQTFIEEECARIPGAVIQITHFYTAFYAWLPVDQQHFWTQRRIKRELPPELPVGRYTGEGQIHIGNLSLSKETVPGPRLEKRGDRLWKVGNVEAQ